MLAEEQRIKAEKIREHIDLLTQKINLSITHSLQKDKASISEPFNWEGLELFCEMIKDSVQELKNTVNNQV